MSFRNLCQEVWSSRPDDSDVAGSLPHGCVNKRFSAGGQEEGSPTPPCSFGALALLVWSSWWWLSPCTCSPGLGHACVPAFHFRCSLLGSMSWEGAASRLPQAIPLSARPSLLPFLPEFPGLAPQSLWSSPSRLLANCIPSALLLLCFPSAGDSCRDASSFLSL